jgi:hypothetical protein
VQQSQLQRSSFGKPWKRGRSDYNQHVKLHHYNNIDDLQNDFKQLMNIPRAPSSINNVRITNIIRLADMMIEPVLSGTSATKQTMEWHSTTGSQRYEWSDDISDRWRSIAPSSSSEKVRNVMNVSSIQYYRVWQAIALRSHGYVSVGENDTLITDEWNDTKWNHLRKSLGDWSEVIVKDSECFGPLLILRVDGIGHVDKPPSHGKTYLVISLTWRRYNDDINVTRSPIIYVCTKTKIDEEIWFGMITSITPPTLRSSARALLSPSSSSMYLTGPIGQHVLLVECVYPLVYNILDVNNGMTCIASCVDDVAISPYDGTIALRYGRMVYIIPYER